ncbi:ABC transporter substrate-binding protein [Roseovarius sp. ZX-A-9]|uniref:ABC transporter substrate-binding protein n=1 Tax=Roseovarius sp. ZX-A-9 TaxID=3014783 RepID=UPI002330BED2|nr:ABC transporter substrate-binding protein [Roseovarius sp. ZX-A-9]
MSNFQRDCCEILAERFRSGKLDRRSFLTGLAALGAVTIARPDAALAAENELVVVNWGGDAIDAYSAAFAEALQSATGLKLKLDGSGPLEGSMKTQFESNAVRWDVCDAEPYSALRLGRENMMEPINYDIVDRAKVQPGFDAEFSVPSYFFSYVMAYDTNRFDTAPATWADFWDVDKFPGKRTLYKWMTGVLEAALLADGVSPAELYPLDVDRALAKIEAIKPHVVSFWQSGAESQQLLRDGEASMGLLWHTRANLTKMDTEGEVDWTFDQGLVTPSGWCTIKGNPAGAEAAMQFIELSQTPEHQLILLEQLGNGPANPAAHAMVPDEHKAIDASSAENLERQVALQSEWYADHFGPALDKYLALVSD